MQILTNVQGKEAHVTQMLTVLTAMGRSLAFAKLVSLEMELSVLVRRKQV